MSTINDIDKAVKIFEENNCPYELMHSISTYPMKIENANLETIRHLKEKYKCNVGYSGHETGIAVSLAAVGYDIKMVGTELDKVKRQLTKKGGGIHKQPGKPDMFYHFAGSSSKPQIKLDFETGSSK